ncbi:hypothetical protein CTAYLR_004820 [Chrysophaeum taylorii]|uniref:Sulfotransferase domain-containing protein n=1 Tax=Chrysophaeum taylorii TaxID=2483200 RepID=A0AAD7UPG6_9STRA|nr:hypothetical protein CTAYLR_004820 [Chrysophaeum taylorii]
MKVVRWWWWCFFFVSAAAKNPEFDESNTARCRRTFDGPLELDLDRWHVKSMPFDIATAVAARKHGSYTFRVSDGQEAFTLKFAMVEGVPWPQPINKAKYERSRETVRLRSGDVVVATYPKSGTTWMEQIVLLLLHGADAASKLSPESRNTLTKSTGIGKVWLEPMLAGTRSGRFTVGDFDRMSAPRVIKSHAPYHMLMGIPRPGTGRGISTGPLEASEAKVVYVARNAKDAAVSLYYQRAPVKLRRRELARFQRRRLATRDDDRPGRREWSFRDNLLLRMLQRRRDHGGGGSSLDHGGSLDPLRVLLNNGTVSSNRRMPMDAWCALYLRGAMSCGSYFDHVARWYAASRSSSNVLFVTYEDMKRDPTGVIKRVAAHLGVSRSDSEIARVHRASTFEAMQAQAPPRTKTSGTRSKASTRDSKFAIPPGTPFAKVNRTASGHLRQGLVGSWRTHFSAKLSDQFDAIYAAQMANAVSRAARDFGVPPEAPEFYFGCNITW